MEASVAPVQDRDRDEHQNFNEEIDNNESDIDDTEFFDDGEFSSPSTNSDQNNIQWYAYRGRFDVYQNRANNLILNNEIALQEPPQIQQDEHPEQNQIDDEEEETDFLEMDFEPENSENEMLNGHNDNVNGELMDVNQLQNNQALENFNQASSSHTNYHQQNHTSTPNEPCSSNYESTSKNTGAKPKILKQTQKPSKSRHVMDGDNVFKITGHFPSHSEEYYDSQQPGCSSSFLNGCAYQEPTTSSNFFKSHRSPVKSCHSSHKQKNIERQNEDFLFEIEPIRPRNSVTIYTSNCDEKILLDALVSVFEKFEKNELSFIFSFLLRHR